MSLIPREVFATVGLAHEQVAVIGYGSQGRAQALNLRDSGVSVQIGLRDGSPSAAPARAEGFDVLRIEKAAAQADLLALLVPDEVQPAVYYDAIAPVLATGAALVFAHGYNIHYGLIKPRADLDVILVAPSAIGEVLRARYMAGGGTAGFLAIGQDATGHARRRMLAYARALGHDRVAAVETSFAEETETDLFSEQAVLVGGLTGLILSAFETLVEAGYQPEVAYYCCFEEVKYMTDVLFTRGLAGMRAGVSSTAAFGALGAEKRIFDKNTRSTMRSLLAEIREGRFAAALAREMNRGAPDLIAELHRLESHPLEIVRSRLARDVPPTAS